MQVRCMSPLEAFFYLTSLALSVSGIEFKGGSSNVALHRPSVMSSISNSEAYATDGQDCSTNFALTQIQDAPWWRVDLGYPVPTFVVRIYGIDIEDSVRDGVEVRIGDADTWDQATPCATGIAIRVRLPTVVNCIGEGRYVFVAAPQATQKMLALCEVEVLPRGPSGSQEWWGTTGRPFSITVEGKALDSKDRIRIVEPTQLCGEAATLNMHSEVVERSSPSGPPTSVNNVMNGNGNEVWEDVKILTLGYYKVCWCSGRSKQCVQGQDFPFNAGYIVITGELRTVVGTGMELQPSAGDTQAWEPMNEVDIGRNSGVALSGDGLKLFYSEPNRIRMVNLPDAMVKTIAGSQAAGFSGDDGPATSARLSEPTGLSSCKEPDSATPNGYVWGNEYVLVADTMNNRIRYINLASGNITTVVGNGNAAYFGNGDTTLDPIDASLNQPRGVACDPSRFGMWISDTGNNAVRLVNQGVIRTVAGVPPTKGFSPEGAWSESSRLDGPQQVVVTSFGNDDLNVAFAEKGSILANGEGDLQGDPNGGGALARWMAVPTFTLNFGSNMNNVAGTGEQGYQVAQNNYLTDAELLQPEGVAMHNSLAFVSDTMNHRIWMTPVVEYEHFGCWNEKKFGERLVPLVEGDSTTGLTGTPGFNAARRSTRDKAVEQCAVAALRLGFKVFAVRNGGECAASATAETSYYLEGRYFGCQYGIGSIDANDVYKLLPHTTLDLIGRMHAVIGRALSTADNFFSERPRSGYVGDTKSSWVSAVNEPSQLALDRNTGNLYFADRGNFRIRVLFGQFGPRPFTQHFVCTNGRPCTLGVTGNGLYLKDSVGFLRKVSATGSLLCGQEEFDDQFNSNITVAERNKAFLKKTFNLGNLSLRTVGNFKICYCVWEASGRCTYKPNFDFVAGTLQIVGPNVLQDVSVVAGAPFNLVVRGAGLQTQDRVRFILASEECGVGNDLMAIQPAHFSASLARPREEGSADYEIWKGIVVKQTIDIAVCWCNQNGCNSTSDFDVRMAALHVRGPVYTELPVNTGTPFDLVLRGSGSFMVTNRARLQDSSLPCESNQPGPDAILDAALPWYALPCGISATSATWCNVVLHHPGSLHVCWCGSTTQCVDPSDYNVLAAKLTVTGALVSSPASGPFYNASTPRPSLGSSSIWPEQMTVNALTIMVNAYTRKDVPDSGTPGPIHVAVCETAHKCLPPAMLQYLAPGVAAEGTSLATSDMLPFKPKGILITSLSSSPWLADSIDVAIGNSWRRFTINRWLADLNYASSANDGSTPWSVYTTPPRAMPVSREVFTLGDNCGGCPVGWECRDRNETDSSDDGVCRPVCGDGLPVVDEQCDDGNLQSLDGCDSQCRVEVGFDCLTQHGVSASICRPRTCPGAIGLNDYDAVCNAVSNVTDLHFAVACWSMAGPLCRPSPPSSAPWFPSLSAASSVWPGCSQQWMTGAGGLWLCGHVEVRPRAVLTTLIEAGRGFVVAFDAPMEVVLGEVPCATIFNTTTIASLGDRATCKWASHRHLIARLGFGTSFGLIPGLNRVDILDIARQHLDISIPVLEPWKFPSQIQGLSALTDVSPEDMPVVVLRAPVVGSTCGNVTFDARGSRGSYGRQWKRIIWRCEGAHCAELLVHIPSECTADGSGEAIAFGPVACGLVLTLPEVASGILASKEATLTVKLELVNVLGLSAYGEHTISFTTDRVPVAVALSETNLVVAANANTPIEFELTARAAMPVSTVGSCQFSDSLGPIGVSWAYGSHPSDPSETLATAWTNLQSMPPTLTSANRVGILSGLLGSLAQPGKSWMVLARVEHAPSSTGLQPSPVYVRFNVSVASAPLDVKLQVPRKISSSCPLEARAITSNLSSAASYRWTCSLTSFTPGDATSHQTCSQAASASTGDSFVMTSLAAGVYSIEVEVSVNSVTKKASAIVSVFENAGPPVRILEPSGIHSMGLSSPSDNRQFYFRTLVQSLGLSNCAPASLSAAVVVFGLVPNSGVTIVADSRVVVDSFELETGMSEIQVNAQIPLNTLTQGLSYKFQLLLSPFGASLATHVQRISSIDPRKLPSSLMAPQGVWAHESLPFSHSLPFAFAFWATPKSGTAARTLFQLQSRARCDGCVFSYRFASAKAEATDAMSCDDAKVADSPWLMLRTWNAESEARLPFLSGSFVVEARAQSPDGGIERECTIINVASGGPAIDFSGGADAAIAALNAWVADVSSTVNLLRSAGEPSATLLSLQAVAIELPDMTSFEEAFGLAALARVTVPVRNLFENMCVTLIESVLQLDASYFVSPSRRLASSRRLSARHLEALVDTVLMITQKLGPLVSAAEMSLSLQVLEALLGRNAAVRGLLGSPAIGTPTSVATNFFALCELILNYGASLSKSGQSVPKSIATTLTSVALQLGDVVGAALPQSASAEPFEVKPLNSQSVLWVKHLSGSELRAAGISQTIPVQQIERPVYAGMSIPALGTDFSSVEDTLSTNAAGACLGAGVSKPLDAVVLVTIAWSRDPRAIGLANGALPKGINMTSIYTIALRTCGRQVVVDSADLGGNTVDAVFEISSPLLNDLRWGYEDSIPFRCMHYSDQWTATGCSSWFRAKGASEIAKFGPSLPEGALGCSCQAWPNEWGVEVVPRPIPIDPPEVNNRSFINLTLYATIIVASIAILMLTIALLGDLALLLAGDDISERLGRILMSTPPDLLGIQSDAVAYAAGLRYWPLHSGLVEMLYFYSTMTLNACCCSRAKGRRERLLEVAELEALGRGGISQAISQRTTTNTWDMPKDKIVPIMVTASGRGINQVPVRAKTSVASMPVQGINPRMSANQQHQSKKTALPALQKASEKSAAPLVNAPVAETPVPPIQVTGFTKYQPPPLPEGWEVYRSQAHKGREYYVNLFSSESTWVKPRQPALTQMSLEEIKELLGSAAEGVNLRYELEAKLRARLAERRSEEHNSRAARENDFYNVNDIGADFLDAENGDRPAARMMPEARHYAPPPVVIIDCSDEQYEFESGVDERLQAADNTVTVLSGALNPSRSPGRSRFSPKGVISHSPNRLLAAAPRPTFMVEPVHQVALPRSDSASRSNQQETDELRVVANVSHESESIGLVDGAQSAPHSVRVAEAIEDVVKPDETLPLKLTFASWGLCKLIRHCWVRNCPFFAVLLPDLVLTRTMRCIVFIIRLTFSLFLAVVVSSCVSWKDKLDEEVDVDERSNADLREDLSTAFSIPFVFPLGIICRVVGGALAHLSIVPGPPRPIDAGIKEWLRWWRTCRTRMWRNSWGMMILAVLFLAGSLIVASVSPQPRQAVAFAAFLVILTSECVVEPTLAGVGEAWILWRVGRSSNSCYGNFLVLCPYVMDFAHVHIRWRSRNALLGYTEALLEERRACLTARAAAFSRLSAQKQLQSEGSMSTVPASYSSEPSSPTPTYLTT